MTQKRVCSHCGSNNTADTNKEQDASWYSLRAQGNKKECLYFLCMSCHSKVIINDAIGHYAQ